MNTCPICGQRNSKRQLRCHSCGADLFDPETAAALGDISENLLEGVETLSASKVLGVSAEALDSGAATAKLALVGAALGVFGFLIPLSPDFQHYLFPWEGDVTLALWLPLVVTVLGLAIGIVRPARVVQSSLLALLGVVGLFSTHTLGSSAASATALPFIFTSGVLLTSVAAIVRLYSAESQHARIALAVGSLLIIAGLLLPTGAPDDLLPAEMRFYGRGSSGTKIPLLLLWERAKAGGHLTFFIGVFALCPALVAPAAAAAAYSRPRVWDRGALALRPLTWILVLFPALAMALGTFNLMGWDQVRTVIYDGHAVAAEDFTQAAMTGRAKMAVLYTAYCLWGSFGLVALYRRLVLTRATE